MSSYNFYTNTPLDFYENSKTCIFCKITRQVWKSFKTLTQDNTRAVFTTIGKVVSCGES